MLVAALTNFGVKNQVPHFLFKTVDGDLVLFSSYEVADILLCDSLYISEAISDYGAPSFALNNPSASLPLITCSSPHRTSKEEYILHLPEHLLLILGNDFTTHVLMFMDATYQFLDCSSHVLNPQEAFLTYQLTSIALHGSILHPATVYISNLVEHIIILPKRNIPLDIMMDRFTFQASDTCAQNNQIDLDYTCLIRGGAFFPYGFLPNSLY